MNKKAVAVLSLSKLSVPQKIELARFIVLSMTGNANFTTPNPTLAVITANANSLETAHLAAQGGGKDETSSMYAKETALDISLTTLASYVQGIANANFLTAESVILSAGINTKKPASARPNGFRVSAGKNPGEVQIRTNSSNRATFIMEATVTPDDENSWETLYSGTRSQFLAMDLNSGIRYYFRVAKTDKEGQGPWSTVLNIVVA
jgi:hypothetical protein